MNEIVLIVGMALVTFAVRYPVMALVSRVQLPEPVFRGLRYVPPAVLAAIIVPAVLMPEGEIALSPTNAYLVAGLASALVAWRARNLLLSIVIGMVVMLVWRALIG